MIEKLLGMMLGFALCKAWDGLGTFASLFTTTTGPTPPAGSPGPSPSAWKPDAPAFTIPAGATPATLPPGAIPVVSPSSAVAPEALPGGLPPFPGPGWAYAKTTPAVVQRAWALLPVLKLHQYKVEPSPDDPNKWLAYRKERHANGKTGVTVYTPRKRTTTSQASAPVYS